MAEHGRSCIQLIKRGGAHMETQREGREGMRRAQGNRFLVERMLDITVLRSSVVQAGQREKRRREAVLMTAAE